MVRWLVRVTKLYTIIGSRQFLHSRQFLQGAENDDRNL